MLAHAASARARSGASSLTRTGQASHVPGARDARGNTAPAAQCIAQIAPRNGSVTSRRRLGGVPDGAACAASKRWMPKPISFTVSTACAAALFLASGAHAWTRPGHMVTAAIAYDDLAAGDGAVIARLGELLAQHPDRGAFEVASG